MNASVVKPRPSLMVAAVSVSVLAWTIHEESKNPSKRLFSSSRIQRSDDALYPCRPNIARCDDSNIPVGRVAAPADVPGTSTPSWFRRRVLAPIGFSLPTPRLLTPEDPALKLPAKCIRQRQQDELKLRKILEKAPAIRHSPEQMKALSQELFEVTYGKGVTAQEREDFLVRYGCTGWNEKVLGRILDITGSRGIVEIGAGHGQWARALNEAYAEQEKARMVSPPSRPLKQFDFVLAYDDNSNLPLNTHIYNPYTKPHHEYFGNVRTLESPEHLGKVLRSWTCRGRILLLVYPPPSEMATQVVTTYVNAAPEDNNTVIFIGEGRGGANGDESLFDYFENGEWELVDEMDVFRPPGDKGYEKLFVLRRRMAPE